VLWIDAQLARKDGQVFELLALLQQPFLAELGEPVEEMIDDVSDEYVDAETVGHLLRLAFHLHVERHYHSVSTHQHVNNVKSLKPKNENNANFDAASSKRANFGAVQ